jgi:hypothetical protein
MYFPVSAMVYAVSRRGFLPAAKEQQVKGEALGQPRRLLKRIRGWPSLSFTAKKEVFG